MFTPAMFSRRRVGLRPFGRPAAGPREENDSPASGRGRDNLLLVQVFFFKDTSD